jgi:inhibitor of cysteine peptidase
MVQREISKKVPVYGLVAVLSALMLIAMVNYGIAPGISPNPSAMPGASTNPNTDISLPNAPDAAPMLTFTSYDELNSFVTNTANRNHGSTDGMPVPSPVPNVVPSVAPTTFPAFGITTPSKDIAAQDQGAQGSSYSNTNIQVAGVDEADSVKTDGKYLYVIANNTVYVMNAGSTNPSEAKVLAKISSDSTYLSGIYLSQDGNKLAVLGTKYITYTEVNKDPSLIMPPYWNSGSTFVQVYDVTNKASPTLTRNFTISGSYFNSRMIGNYIYTIITENVYTDNGKANLPVVFSGPEASNVQPTKIFYADSADSSYTYTTVIGLNLMDNSAPSKTSIMMGGASDMFVSANNIYVTYQAWTPNSQNTNIYRISVNQGNLKIEAKGSVPGSTINKYAMDEYNGYFRIATTQWMQDNATTTDGAIFKVGRQLNSIYVLKPDLTVTGKLERFKMDESIYSVRFIGNKCYIVTFKQIDPFFVIDMSNPAAPKVAGELKIPGYSSYLHPYDENHIIGIGMENNTVKLSLFDVTNVNAPTETAKYIVQSQWSDSPIAYDPHAFLFDAQRQLLVIPVTINNYNVGIRPVIGSPEKDIAASAIAPSYWQGVYVFNLNTANGFTLRGNITQIDITNQQTGDYYWMGSNFMINRALYIGNTLYTVSNGAVQLNSLDNLALLGKISLS